MIDNRNEYKCVCHPAFTGKYCDARIETTTATTTTTEAAKTTRTMSTTSQVPEVFKSKVIVSKKYLHIASGSRSYSVQEIILIIVLGVGMPVFAILCTVLLCRLSRSTNKAKYFEAAPSKTIEFDSAEKKAKKIEHVSVQEEKANGMDVNIFTENELNETKVCVKTISSELKATSTPMKKQNGFNLVENNIYSVFNYSDKVSTEEVNLKNSTRNAKLNQMCQMQQQQSEYGALSSMV